MENGLEAEVVAYLLDGSYESIRSALLIGARMGPSEMIARGLASDIQAAA